MNNKNALVNAIFNLTSDEQGSDDKKKITCAEAFQLARKYNTEIIEIGHICNEHNIKIRKCQLGCFD